MSSYAFIVASFLERHLTPWSSLSKRPSIDQEYDSFEGNTSSHSLLTSSPGSRTFSGDKGAGELQRELERERERERDRERHSNTGSLRSFLCCCKIPVAFAVDVCLVPGKSLADNYPFLLNSLVYSPTFGSLIFLILWLLFLVVYVPVWLFSFVVGSYCSTLALVVAVGVLCRRFARFMAFPGSSSSFMRDISGDYLKRLSIQLSAFATLCAHFAVLVASNGATRSRLGAKFHITGADAGDMQAKGINIFAKTTEISKWIAAIEKIYKYIDTAMADFRSTQSSANYVVSSFSSRSGAYTASVYNRSWCSIDRMFPLVLRFCLGNENTAVKRLAGKPEIDEVMDPIKVLHQVLGTLLTNIRILVSFVVENADLYGNASSANFKRPKNPPVQDVNSLDPSNVVASIGMIVRSAESLRAALQYMLERASSDEGVDTSDNFLGKLTNGVPVAQGIVNALLRSRTGAIGPALLSTSIMRAQLVETYQARRFTVMGDDGNFIDCVLFPGNKTGEKRRKKRSKGRNKKAPKQAVSRQGENAESDDCDSDETSNTATTTGTLNTAVSNSKTNSHVDQSEQDPLKKHMVGTVDFYEADSAFSSSKYGTCLFCAPNAGLWESWAIVPENSSWLVYYTQNLGMDLVLFNYRGYSESSGVATPDRVKSDGLAVYDFIRNQLRVQHLVLHGESIGGMVANSIAAWESASCRSDESITQLNCSGSSADADGDVEMKGGSNTKQHAVLTPGSPIPEGHPIVKALICDRTFASLDAVASKLLGTWAAYGLWYLGGWRTNTVVDFLRVSTTKIILQDTSDQIINNLVSLQAGVATVEAKSGQASDFHFWPKRMDYELTRACVERQVPTISNRLKVLSQGLSRSRDHVNPPKGNVSLEELSSAFTACLFTIAERARVETTFEQQHESVIHISAFEPTLEWVCEYCCQPLGLPSDSNAIAQESPIVGVGMTQEVLKAQLTLLEKVWVILLRTENGAGYTLAELILDHAVRDGSNNNAIFSDADLTSNILFEAVYIWLCSVVVYGCGSAMRSDAENCVSFSFSRGIEASAHDLDALFKQHEVTTLSLQCGEEYEILMYFRRALSHILNVQGDYTAKNPFAGKNAGFLIPVTCGHSGWPDNKAMSALTACLEHAGFPVSAVDEEQTFNFLFSRK